MVETYSSTSNQNMRRPVVKQEIVDFMRTSLEPVTTNLKSLELFAHRENIPIIPHETVAYFRFIIESIKPTAILEIGTAIGFSALLMAESAPEATITTIDRNPEMIALAKENFEQFDSRKQITLMEGEAMDILPTLEDSYDFVFMDSAKSKYVVFLPEILNHLTSGGIIIIDDVFQGGDIAKPAEEIRRGQRAIYRGLHKLFDTVLNDSSFTSSFLPLGDGLLMIRKK